MAKRADWLTLVESRWSLLGLLGGTGAVSAVAAWLARQTEWLNTYGPISWLLAALIAGLLFGALFLLTAWGWKKLVEAKAIRTWQRRSEGDLINPLEPEFHRRRIEWAKLRHPVTGAIEGKGFLDCEFLGPAVIFFHQDVEVTDIEFINCDFVLTNGVFQAFNLIPLRRIKIRGGVVANTTIFVHPSVAKLFLTAPGVRFVTATSNDEMARVVEAVERGLPNG